MRAPFARNPLLPLDPLASEVAYGKRAPSTFVESAIVNTSRADMALIYTITQRAVLLAERFKTLIPSSLQLGLDLAIAHQRRPLRLHALLMTSDAEFHREFVGIAQHIDRENGRMREGWTSAYWAEGTTS